MVGLRYIPYNCIFFYMTSKLLFLHIPEPDTSIHVHHIILFCSTFYFKVAVLDVTMMFDIYIFLNGF